MPSERSRETRRFLLTGVAHSFANDPGLNRPGLVEGRDEIIQLFGELGYVHDGRIPDNPTANELINALRSFSTDGDRRPDDIVVIYLAGHGDIRGDRRGAFIASDGTTDIHAGGTISSYRLGEVVLADTKINSLLVLLDTCYSGQLGFDFAEAVGKYRGADSAQTPEASATIVMISASAPAQRARVGVFVEALRKTVEAVRRAPLQPGRLRLDAVIELLTRGDPEQTQRIWSNSPLITGEIIDFFANPGAASGKAEQDNRRADDLKTHFLTAYAGTAQYADPPHDRRTAVPPRFRGRARARQKVIEWLTEQDRPRWLFVVGGPGSGKSALLGWAAQRSAYPGAWRNTEDAPGPPPKSLDVAINAAGLPAGGLIAAIAAASSEDIEQLADGTGVALEALLSRLGRRGKPLVVLIDGLEMDKGAVGPVHEVLQPLLDARAANIRVIVGCRPELVDALGIDSQDVLDLDGDYADPGALHDRVSDELLLDHPERRPAKEEWNIVAGVIAEAAQPSFLRGIMLARLQQNPTEPPDVEDPQWRATLTHDAGALLVETIRARFGRDTGLMLALMGPLAYAYPARLPADLWPVLAEALNPEGDYGPHNRARAQREASYCIASDPGEPSQHWLIHQTLAEHLRASTHEARVADHTKIVAALRGSVEQATGPDWANAPDYVKHQLPHHAAISGDIETLAQDPRFLLAMDPTALLAALDAADGPQARAAATAYRRAVPMLRRRPEQERLSYLGLAARCARADRLADQLPSSLWRARWASWRLQRPHVAIDTGSPVSSVALFEDHGRLWVISGTDDGAVRLWDAQTGSPLRALTGHVAEVTAVAVVRIDQNLLVISGDGDGSVQVHDWSTGELTSEPLRGEPLSGDGIPGVTALTTGQLDGQAVIISGWEDGTVHVTDLAGTRLSSPVAEAGPATTALMCGRVGNQVVAVRADTSGYVTAWDLDSQEVLQRRWFPRPANAVALSSVERPAGAGGRSGRREVVVVAANRDVTVWDLYDREQPAIAEFQYSRPVEALATNALGGRSIVASADEIGTIRIADLSTGAPVGASLVDNGRVKAIATARLDGRPILASGGQNRTVRVWDLAAKPVGDPFVGHNLAVYGVAVTELEGHPVVVSVGRDGTARVWDLATGSQIHEPFTEHAAPVTAVATAVMDERPVVVTGAENGQILVWNLQSREVHDVYRAHRHRINALAIARIGDTDVVISGDASGKIRVWTLAGREDIRPEFEHSRYRLRGLATAALENGNVLLSAGEDGVVRVWDLATQAFRRRFPDEDAAPVLAITAFNHLGNTRVVIGSKDGSVAMWEPSSRQLVERYQDHAHRVLSVAAWSGPDGLTVMSGSQDRTVRIRRIGHRSDVTTLTVPHSDWVRALAVVNWGHETMGVSGSGDGAIRMFNADTGDERFAHHSHWVRALAAARLDGRDVIVTGSVDNTIRVWDSEHGAARGAPLTGHSRGIRTLAVAELDGRTVVVSGDDDSQVRAHFLDNRAPVGETYTRHDDWVRALAVVKLDGTPVVTSAAGRAIRVWNLRDGQDRIAPMQHPKPVRALAAGRANGAEALVSADAGGGIRVWDIRSGRRLLVVDDGVAIRGLAVTEFEGCQVVVSAADDGSAVVRRLDDLVPVGSPLPPWATDVTSMSVVRRHRLRTARDVLRVVLTDGPNLRVLRFESPGEWHEEALIDLGCDILAVLTPDPKMIVAGCQLGTVALDVPSERRPGT